MSHTYTVQRGDNLWKIARENNVSHQDLIRANPHLSNPNLIRPGERLQLPSDHFERTNPTNNSLIHSPNSPASGLGLDAPGASTGNQYHRVRRGESLWGIARSHNISLRDLTAANPQISNPSLIQPGQQIRLPGQTPAPQPTAPTSPTPAPPETPANRVPSGTFGNVYRDHQANVDGMNLTTGGTYDYGLRAFEQTWNNNRPRYEAVAQRTNIPAPLIAALHFRESSSDFGTYLHQGDPLGRPAVHHPRNIPVFHNWEDAAVDALQSKSGLRDQLGMNAQTTDKAAMATFAEGYNGLGYHNRGLESPYVYAGTDVYTGGRYVRDGVFDPNSWDQRPGVMALMAKVEGTTDEVNWTAPRNESTAWNQVVTGNEILRNGKRGAHVSALQTKLTEAGYPLTADGIFGPRTESAVRAFQRTHGLTVDGRVGPQTAGALNGSSTVNPAVPANPNPHVTGAALEHFPIGGNQFNIGYDSHWNNFNAADAHHNSDYSRRATNASHPTGHLGVDIFGPRGAPVVSPVTGVVASINRNSSVGGNTVTVRRGNHYFYHAHLDSIAGELRVGSTISAGTSLGALGNSGNARGTEPHVHFSIYQGANGYRSGTINPFPSLEEALPDSAVA